MALTRKLLTALGIEAEKIDEIITAHTETTDALKAQRDEYKDEVDKLNGEVSKLQEAQKELDDLKEAAEKNQNSPYKVKYEELQKEFDAYKNQISEKESQAKKESAYRSLLKEAGIAEQYIDSVLKVSVDAIGSIEFDDKDNVKDAKKISEELADTWHDFVVKKETKGADVKTPPKNDGGSTLTKADIMKIKDTNERQKAIADNPQLFGITE